MVIGMTLASFPVTVAEGTSEAASLGRGVRNKGKCRWPASSTRLAASAAGRGLRNPDTGTGLDAPELASEAERANGVQVLDAHTEIL